MLRLPVELVLQIPFITLMTSDTAIRFPAADTFTVETGGSERIRFTSGGTIGIGDNSPNSGETLVVARFI